MKSYRRRFVLYNMLLIGFVLIVTFVSVGIYMYRSELSELEKTMALVVEPWDGPSERTPGGENEGGLTMPDGGQGSPGMPGPGRPDDGEHVRPDSGKPPRRNASDDILTIFYDRNSGEISVISNRSALDEATIDSAVEEIAAANESFGRLKTKNLIYMRENTANGCKIALADTAYITSRMWRNALLLLAAFIGAMGLFFPVSLWLSRLASRPMERAVEMERQFVQDISHDLKTPVTVVLANNSILRSNPDATMREQEQWIASTDEAAHSMMDLVDQMLTLAALDGSAEQKPKDIKANSTQVDLSQTVEKWVLQMESVAYDRGVELVSDVAEGLCVRSEQSSVEKIVSGLIENALKYEPDGGKVEVRLERSGKNRRKIVYTVKNFGSFISEEDISHIFERFYRGDKARSEKGHGLGLPILKRTAELIGAELGVASAEADGTVFTAVFEAKED